MVAFYQRSIISWMDGTEGLDDGQYRAYDIICNLIYLNNGPIVPHESGIAGRCNQHKLAFRRNLAKLIELGKIIVTTDGKLTNKRVESELSKIIRKSRPSANPPATPAQPPPGSAGVGRGSEGGRANKLLKTKEPARGRVGKDYTREEDIDSLFPDGNRGAGAAESVVMKDPPLDPEADYYRRGKEVLGAKAGGVLTNLLVAKGGNLALARAAIEHASTRGDAAAYVGAMIRNVKNGGGSEANRIGYPAGGNLDFNGIAAATRAGRLARERAAASELQPDEPPQDNRPPH
jgi:hypothetical protein